MQNVSIHDADVNLLGSVGMSVLPCTSPRPPSLIVVAQLLDHILPEPKHDESDSPMTPRSIRSGRPNTAGSNVPPYQFSEEESTLVCVSAGPMQMLHHLLVQGKCT